jgi:hypothetical protein
VLLTRGRLVPWLQEGVRCLPGGIGSARSHRRWYTAVAFRSPVGGAGATGTLGVANDPKTRKSEFSGVVPHHEISLLRIECTKDRSQWAPVIGVSFAVCVENGKLRGDPPTRDTPLRQYGRFLSDLTSDARSYCVDLFFLRRTAPAGAAHAVRTRSGSMTGFDSVQSGRLCATSVGAIVK